MLSAGIACNASKHPGRDPNYNEVDSLPPTIIAPAKDKPVLADTTSLNNRDFFQLDEQLQVVKVSERGLN
jgi:hypothetical protein